MQAGTGVISWLNVNETLQSRAGSTQEVLSQKAKDHARARTAGTFLLLAVVAFWLGQFVAALFWQGIYDPSYFLIRDLAAPQCVFIESDVLPRYVCSPAHLAMQFGLLLAGVAVCIAGALLLSRFQVIGAAMIAVGVSLELALAGALTQYDALANVAHTAGVLAAWIWIVAALLQVVRRQALEAPKLLSTLAAVISGVGLVVSAVGLWLYVSGGALAPFGMYQRMSVEVITIFVILFAASLRSWGKRVDAWHAAGHAGRGSAACGGEQAL